MRNKQKTQAYQKQWRLDHPNYASEWRRKNRKKCNAYSKHQKEINPNCRQKTKSDGYGGAMTCPKCGQHGYKYYVKKISGTEKEYIYTTFQHHIWDPILKRPRVIKTCHIGAGKL